LNVWLQGSQKCKFFRNPLYQKDKNNAGGIQTASSQIVTYRAAIAAKKIIEINDYVKVSVSIKKVSVPFINIEILFSISTFVVSVH
jgi:hypothetical protein